MFFDEYGSTEKCEALVHRWRWSSGLVCPRREGSWHSEFRRQERSYFECLPPAVHLDRWHHLRVQQAAAVHLIPGHLLDDAGQECCPIARLMLRHDVDAYRLTYKTVEPAGNAVGAPEW